MDSPIASLKIVKVAADGRRIAVKVEIGQPHPHPDGGWCCPVLLAGIDDTTRNTYGEDSLQALCLALHRIRSQLESVIELGGRLLEGDGTDFPLDAYFGTLWSNIPAQNRVEPPLE
jgi:hypothetical protein